MGRLGVILLSALAFLGTLVGLPQPASAAPATANTVYYWNDVLLESIRREGGGPGPLARAAAMMHAGLFDAINSAAASKKSGAADYDSYLTLRIVDKSVDADLAAGYAARDLLIEAM